MSKIKALFFPKAVDENRNVSKDEMVEFLSYINSVGDEGTQFDAKDIGKILDNREMINLDKTKVELAKHVSAFTNTSGGLMAIGIREDKEAPIRFSFNCYDLTLIDQQHLQRAISTSVEPPAHYSIELVEIERDGDRPLGIILLFLEQSQNPPHQVVYNRTYYFRHGEMSYPAPHSLVLAMFSGRRGPKLEADLIKVEQPPHLRLLIKNKGTAAAHHTHIIINIFPRPTENGRLLLSKKHIEESTDGMWMIKTFQGNEKRNFMKLRLRAQPGQIILPGVNEILFDLPFESCPNVKMKVDLYCEGSEEHQEFLLD